MPITQDRMLVQIQEARHAFTFARDLRDMVRETLERLVTNGPIAGDWATAINALRMNVDLMKPPTDRETYRNEFHYNSVRKRNQTSKERATAKRRERGALPQPLAMERLNAMNAARRRGNASPNDFAAYRAFNAQHQPSLPSAPKPKSVLDGVETWTEKGEDIATPESIHNAIASGGLFGSDEIAVDKDGDGD